MGKKFKKLDNMEKALLREIERRDYLLKKMIGEFYPDGIIAEFSFPASYNDYFGCYYEQEKAYLEDLTDKEKSEDLAKKRQMYEEIQKNIQEGTPGNVEICLDKGIVRSWEGEYALGNSIIKIQEYIDSRYSDYIFLKEGDRCDARILMGDTSCGKNILLINNNRKEDDASAIVSIDLFCLLGLCDDGKHEDVEGIATGCFYEPRDIIFWLPEEPWFKRVRELLLVDWLQKKWEKAKAKADKRKLKEEQKRKKLEDMPKDGEEPERVLEEEKLFIGYEACDRQ